MAPRLSPERMASPSGAKCTAFTMQSFSSVAAGAAARASYSITCLPEVPAANRESCTGETITLCTKEPPPTLHEPIARPPATSHSRAVWSYEPESSRAESADQPTSETLWVCSARQRICSCCSGFSMSQQRTVLSNDDDASSRPFGEKRTAYTAPVCPDRSYL